MKLLAIDFRRLAVLLLPTFMRQPVIVTFIGSFMPALTDLQIRFLANRTANLYRLSHNGQVCYLRKVLNDAFPTREKDFVIEDYDPSGHWVYAFDAELFSSQLMIPEASGEIIYSVELIGDYANFTVKIPTNIASDDNLNRIKSLVNTYKLLSKKAIYGYY
ncbi:MAG: hypothetical protein WCG93_12890 [Paludibacter sp.]